MKKKEPNECTMFMLKMQKNSSNPFIGEHKFHLWYSIIVILLNENTNFQSISIEWMLLINYNGKPVNGSFVG